MKSSHVHRALSTSPAQNRGSRSYKSQLSFGHIAFLQVSCRGGSVWPRWWPFGEQEKVSSTCLGAGQFHFRIRFHDSRPHGAPQGTPLIGTSSAQQKESSPWQAEVLLRCQALEAFTAVGGGLRHQVGAAPQPLKSPTRPGLPLLECLTRKPYKNGCRPLGSSSGAGASLPRKGSRRFVVSEPPLEKKYSDTC